MAEKVTIMVLKVDLQCSKCYKKVKKILCQFPQIRDQIFDEKSNTVRITVVCCSPEKIRDKLCCKGRRTIKSIDIIEPKKPDPPKLPPVVENPKPAPPPPKADPKPAPPPPKADPKPAPPPPKADPKPAPPPPKADPPPAPKADPKPAAPPPKADPPPPPKADPKPAAAPPKADPAPPPIGYPPHGCPEFPAYYCLPYYDGPWHEPPPPQPPQQPPPCHCGCGGRSGRDAYGGGYCSNRCDYFSDENPSSCSVM